MSVCVDSQGYRQKDYFIATQGPLPHTVEDFWRMVWEWKCHSIVMLTELQEREQVSSCNQRSLSCNLPPESYGCSIICWCFRTNAASTGPQRTLLPTETTR